MRLGTEVATGRLRAPAQGIEVAQRGHRQRPAPRAVRQRLLDESQVAPLPGPAHQRRRHVVEAGAVERLRGGRPPGWGRSATHGNTQRSPRSPQSSTVACSSSRTTATGSRTRRDTAEERQSERRQLGVAQGVRAHGQTVVVLEQAQGHLIAGPQEVGLVAHAAQADDQVRQPAVHLGHEVEQPRPAREGVPRPGG